jgi:hypothetical protein
MYDHAPCEYPPPARRDAVPRKPPHVQQQPIQPVGLATMMQRAMKAKPLLVCLRARLRGNGGALLTTPYTYNLRLTDNESHRGVILPCTHVSYALHAKVVNRCDAPHQRWGDVLCPACRTPFRCTAFTPELDDYSIYPPACTEYAMYIDKCRHSETPQTVLIYGLRVHPEGHSFSKREALALKRTPLVLLCILYPPMTRVTLLTQVIQLDSLHSQHSIASTALPTPYHAVCAMTTEHAHTPAVAHRARAVEQAVSCIDVCEICMQDGVQCSPATECKSTKVQCPAEKGSPCRRRRLVTTTIYYTPIAHTTHTTPLVTENRKGV